MALGATERGALLESPPLSPSDGAIPMGMCVTPRCWRFGEEFQAPRELSCCLPPRSKVQSRRGEQQRSAPAVPFSKGKQRRDPPRREGRKEPFSRALPPGKRGRGRRGTSRGSADCSARRFPKAVRLISCTDTCAPFPTRR